MISVTALLPAVLIAWLTVPFARHVGFRVGAIDLPNVDVMTHTQPTPRLGGISIVLGTMLPLVWNEVSPATLSLVLAYVALCGMGIYKDLSRRDLAPQLQLLVQLVACWLVTETGEDVTPKLPVRIAVVVGGMALINAVNFLDVSDGLCSSVAAIIATAIFSMTGQLPAV